MNLENISLSEKTKKKLCQTGYQKLTNIQLKTIPLVLEGKDIIAQSQTGTGKTAAFLIPILDKIEVISKPQVLILVPTRELALQVSEEARKLSPHSNLRVLTVFGQNSMREQSKSFRQGVDIVIGTTGRIIDHIDRKIFHLDYLKFVVLDEVDEMIGKGFLKDIEKIMKIAPKSRQTLLFSATLSQEEIERLSRKFAKSPVLITSKNDDLPSNTEHYYMETTSARQKTPNLISFLSKQLGSVIVFANTKRKVEEIKENLWKSGFHKVESIHSNLTQNKRTMIFQKFRAKKISLLIATDVAARGLDIKDISYVINYDFPQDREFYIHRTGRTGRAGASGKAVTFITSPREKSQLLAIARQRNFKVERFANCI